MIRPFILKKITIRFISAKYWLVTKPNNIETVINIGLFVCRAARSIDAQGYSPRLIGERSSELNIDAHYRSRRKGVSL
jgi:hypothetical protein